jgi:hypothetical protein
VDVINVNQSQATVNTSQATVNPQASDVINVNQSQATVNPHPANTNEATNFFDDISDEVLASLPDIVTETETQAEHEGETETQADNETETEAEKVGESETQASKVGESETQVDDQVDTGTAVKYGQHMRFGPRMLNVPRPINGPRMLNVPKPMNRPRMLNVPKITKRCSGRLRKLRCKNIQGPGATSDEPLVVDEDEHEDMTQEPTQEPTQNPTVIASKEGIVLPYIRTMPTLVFTKED